jgi:hypothetical protein
MPGPDCLSELAGCLLPIVCVVLVCNTVAIAMCGLYATVSVAVSCGGNCNMGFMLQCIKLFLFETCAIKLLLGANCNAGTMDPGHEILVEVCNADMQYLMDVTFFRS